MKRLIVVLLLALGGCASELTLTVGEDLFNAANRLELAVTDVRVLTAATIERDARPVSIQVDFRDEAVRFLQNMVVAGGGSQNRAIVQIDKAVISSTRHWAKDIVFAGIVAIAAGLEEHYTANLAGRIEIEDKMRHVIGVAEFSASGSATDKSVTQEEISRGASAAARAALQQAQREIHASAKRYLYKHVKRIGPAGK